MSGLHWLHPTGLFLLAGAVPIVGLYILKARRNRARVASTWLWQTATRDLQARSPWRKLRRELPLILELTALALLALGLSGPACRGRSLGGAHIAIVVDTSASMATRDARTHRTRGEMAQTAVRRLIDGLAAGSDAMLIRAGRDARVVFSLGRDRNALRAAADGVRPDDVEGDLAAAVSLAVDRLRPLSGERRIVVVSDGATAHLDVLPGGPIPIDFVRIGESADNAGIVRLDVRTARDESRAEITQVFALVANHALVARDVYVTVRRDGRRDVLASRRIRIEPEAREPVVLSFPFRAADIGTGIVIELSPPDALAVDDVAYGRIPPGAQLPVALVARQESPWIARALESDPDVALTLVPPDRVAGAPIDALLVFDGVCPTPLPTTHDLLIFAPPAGGCGDVTVLAPIESPQITSYVNTDARFRFLTMDGVHLASGSPLRLGPAATELLRAGDAVLFADASSPERAVTLVGVHPEESDWPLRASFVLFVRNVEEIARAHRARAALSGGRTGDPLRMAVPPTVRAVTVSGPMGQARLQATAGTVVAGETARAGLYRLRWSGAESLAAINLLSDAESNLRAPVLRVERGRNVSDAAGLVKPHEDLTPWLALGAALVLLANLLWLTRREPAIPSGMPTRPGTAGGERRS